MKVYFVASIIGRDPKAKEWQELIISTLHNQGIDVDDINLETDKTHILQESEEDTVQAFERNTKSIKNSDIVIAETSISDSGVGYEIAYALSLKKPVLALYHEDAKEPTAPPIQAGTQRLLSFVRYNSKNIDNLLGDYLKDAKKKLDTKFILIISPEIDRYLEWAADNKRMHKAQIVRNAVEKTMDEDDEWKEYQVENS